MQSRSPLFKVSNSVKKYANVISSVLNMDVDIADNKLMRLAGTGRFSDHVDMYIASEGKAFSWVLENKKPIVVDNPRHHQVCIDCSTRDVCEEEYEISCPIMLDEEVIGVIALATFEKKIKFNISENLPNYLDFLENIADLIAAKAAEYKNYEEQEFTLQLLKRLMDFINDGVIVFSEGNAILFINKKAEVLFGNTLSQLKYLHKIKQFSIQKVKSNNNLSQVEYDCTVKGRRVKLLGNIYPITVGEKEVSEVFVFQDAISLHQNLFQTHQPEDYNFEHIIGREDNFLIIKERAKMLSYSDKNILICGETGIGKEIFARAIHNESRRRNKPFITVMCSSTMDSILEREVFGDNLSSSDSKTISRMELARDGTIFFDEIGDMSLRLQARLMESLKIQTESAVRIIATSSGDLKAMVDSGQFRKDLYYTLETFSITIPPVRSRPLDIELLVRFFLEKYCHLEGKEL
ncbi:MAG: sigma54 specific transcriptional regulator, Fis family, partial [Clostridiales bacterium]|nr:sigma54 specific transcriptional regulator, Fis family [Clostridiales bacterium]